MRPRVLFAVTSLALFALPLAAHAASIPFFGSIIPPAYLTCAGGWGGLVTVINNLIDFALTIGIVFLIPLMIAYAGFLMVINPVNSGGLSEARSILLHAVVGLVIALAAWLIVNTFMNFLYNPAAFGHTTPWYQIITDGAQPYCLPQDQSKGTLAQNTFVNGGVSSAGIPLAPGAIQNLQNGCTANDLAATFGSYAAAMSCVTHFEDPACFPNQPSGSDLVHSATDASTWYPVSIGIFQINLTTNDLNYSSCGNAVGASGPLNCHTAFSGTYTGSASKSQVVITNFPLYQECVSAASILSCNKAAAFTAFTDAQANHQGNPLYAWGTTAQTNCNSLLPSPGTSFVPFWDQFGALVVSFAHLFHE